MAPKIEKIADNYKCAEGPHWDEETQCLYFVDIMGQTINKYVPATNKLTKASTNEQVSFIIPVKGRKNTFLISQGHDLNVINWDGESDSISVIEKNGTTGNPSNFNDAKCDSSGRLWTGSLLLKENYAVEEGVGAIYSVEKTQIRKHVDKISLSNGFAINTQLKKLYFIDSMKMTVDAFDFDIEQGTIKNRQPIFTLSKHDIPGVPDGMTIDTEGNLWVAIVNGTRVVKIDPRKPETLLYTLNMPAKQVTSATFGGRNLDELYITSADFEAINTPLTGALYKVTGLGIKGFPGESFVL